MLSFSGLPFKMPLFLINNTPEHPSTTLLPAGSIAFSHSLPEYSLSHSQLQNATQYGKQHNVQLILGSTSPLSLSRYSEPTMHSGCSIPLLEYLVHIHLLKSRIYAQVNQLVLYAVGKRSTVGSRENIRPSLL